MSSVLNCYKCGAALDSYPSHLCKRCRFELTAPQKTLADRMTPDDVEYLHGLLIRVDEDMMPTGRTF